MTKEITCSHCGRKFAVLPPKAKIIFIRVCYLENLSRNDKPILSTKNQIRAKGNGISKKRCRDRAC